MATGKNRTPAAKAAAAEQRKYDRLVRRQRRRKNRRKKSLTRTYDGKKPIRSSLVWKGSLIRRIVFSIDFWFFSALSVSLGCLETYYCQDDCIPDYDINRSLATSSQLLIFLVLFFNESCFRGYLDQYYLTNKIQRDLEKAAVMLRVHLLDRDHVAAVATLRYMHAAHHLFYYELTGRFFYDFLMQEGLLTHEEIHQCEENPAETWTVCLGWAMREMRLAYENEDLNVYTYEQFEKLICDMRESCTHVLANDKNPPPFPYFQFLQVFIYFFLLLQSWSFHSIEPSYLSIFSNIFSIIILLGMRDMGSIFIDPFGKDETDLKVPLILERSLAGGKAFLLDAWSPAEASCHQDFLKSTLKLAAEAKRHSIVLAMTQDKESPMGVYSEREMLKRQAEAENTEAARQLRAQHVARAEHAEQLANLGAARRAEARLSVVGMAQSVGRRLSSVGGRGKGGAAAAGAGAAGGGGAQVADRGPKGGGARVQDDEGKAPQRRKSLLWPGQASIKNPDKKWVKYQGEEEERTRIKIETLGAAQEHRRLKRRLKRPEISIFDTFLVLLSGQLEEDDEAQDGEDETKGDPVGWRGDDDDDDEEEEDGDDTDILGAGVPFHRFDPSGGPPG